MQLATMLTFTAQVMGNGINEIDMLSLARTGDHHHTPSQVTGKATATCNLVLWQNYIKLQIP